LLEREASALKAGDWVIIDEIQQLPKLLDLVHSLIEEKKIKFALTGSSARKLKRGAASEF
jgi:predicted AAA+ superfamily ATPase